MGRFQVWAIGNAPYSLSGSSHPIIGTTCLPFGSTTVGQKDRDPVVGRMAGTVRVVLVIYRMVKHENLHQFDFYGSRGTPAGDN